MHALFSHPAVQAGLLPFFVALASAELFQRLRLSGLALIAGFAATVYFAADFDFAPLTEIRKVIWLGLAAALLALPLSLIDWRFWRHLLATLAALATVWVVWDLLQTQPLVDSLRWCAGSALYVAWLVYWCDGLRERPVAAANTGIALGLGTGLAALSAATTLPGLFGLALGAAALAYLSIQLVTNSALPCGRSFTLPLALIAGLSACLALVATQQPWYSLVALGLIPLAAHVPLAAKWSVRLQSLALFLLTSAGAAAAVYSTWKKGEVLF